MCKSQRALFCYYEFMKVGILGSGDVGKALAKGFKAEGYDVMIATRNTDSEKAETLKKDLAVEVGNFAETAAFGELIVLATGWSGTEQALQLAEQQNLEGKVVIDVTNPLKFGDNGPELVIGHTNSGGEQVQRWLPKSQVVKAFNIVNNADMYKPSFEQGEPTMLIAGNEDSAKRQVLGILEQFGWEAIDIGDITVARELESLCMLWVKYGRKYGTWHHAFKLLTN